MNVIGVVSAGLQLGFNSRIKKRERGLYSSTERLISRAQVTINELHTDELEITDHPVDSGAQVSDHAFMHPSEVVLQLAWSNSPSSAGDLVNPALGVATAVNSVVRSVTNVVQQALALQSALQSSISGATPDEVKGVYQDLLDLQKSREPFTIYTGKRKYTDMLIKSLATQTDEKTENALFITMTCRQVIRVSSRIVTLPKSAMSFPELMEPIASGRKNAIPQ